MLDIDESADGSPRGIEKAAARRRDRRGGLVFEGPLAKVLREGEAVDLSVAPPAAPPPGWDDGGVYGEGS